MERSMAPSLNKIGITTKLVGSVALLVRANLIFFFQASITAGGSLSADLWIFRSYLCDC